jgi:hypothetical protein
MALSTITVTVDAVNYAFTADSLQQDAVRLLAPSSTLVEPRALTLRRVYPKKSGSYPGNARNSMKLSWADTYADESVTPIIMEVTASRRADTDAAEFLLCRKLLAAIIADSETDGFWASLSL